MNFQISDKVVCVDDSIHPPYDLDEPDAPHGRIERNQIYVVSGVEERLFQSGATLGIFIVGKPRFWRGEEISWGASRFRRLQDMKDEAKIAKPAHIKHP